MSQVIGLTGVTGFIGRRLLRRLLGDGVRVRALVRRPNSLPPDRNLDVIIGDLDQAEALSRLVADCDAVVHLAGAIAGRSRADFIRVNAAGTGRLVEIMERRQPGTRLILISSLAAREPALSDYAASKRAGEVLVESSMLDWFILRPPAVYGPDDPALAPLWEMLARGFLLRAGPEHARFSLLHVDDLCAAISQLLGQATLGQHLRALDDGRPQGYCWADVADVATEVSGRRVRIVPLPSLALRVAAHLNLYSSGLRASPPILVPGKVRELSHIDWVCDSKLADVLYHWCPQRCLKNALPELPGWRQ